MITAIILLVTGIICLLISGMFDAQKDYAKSNIHSKVTKYLYDMYPFYYYSGNNSIGWKWKWKTDKDGNIHKFLDENGNEVTVQEYNKNKDTYSKIKEESFIGASTYNVWVTDWFHFTKKFQIIFLTAGLICLAYVNPLLILLYETINHFGFQLMVRKFKISVIFMYQFEKFGIWVWKKMMIKHNSEFFNTVMNEHTSKKS